MAPTRPKAISALIVCWKLLGGTFTAYIFFTVVLIGIVMGLVAGHYQSSWEGRSTTATNAGGEESVKGPVPERIKKALRYAFVTLPSEIGVDIIIGMAIASLILVIDPLQDFIRQYLTGAVGYAVILVFGLVTYVCSTASVPLSDALIQIGMTQGQAMVYLLVGPITSYATLLVVRKEFGTKMLILYLTVISVLSVLAGVGYDLWMIK